MLRRNFLKLSTLPLFTSFNLLGGKTKNEPIDPLYTIITGPRGKGKTTLLKEKLLECKDEKILMTSASYANSKKFCSIYNNKNITKYTDYCQVDFKNQKIIMLPIYSLKCRGFRPNHVFVDDIESCPKEYLEEVICGLNAISTRERPIKLTLCGTPRGNYFDKYIAEFTRLENLGDTRYKVISL